MIHRRLLATAALTALFTLGQETAPPAGGAGGGTTTPPSGGGAPGGAPGGGMNIPGGNNRTSPFPADRQPFPQMDPMQNRPIFLSGKVRLEDGSAPPEAVTIERICAGRGTPIPEAYTDSKGNFSFQVGQRLGMLPDASISEGEIGLGGRSNSPFGMRGNNPGVSEREIQMCELRASLPGYRSSTVTLAGRRMMDNPDVGTIILRRLGDVTGLTTSATSLMAPKDARKALEKARNALKKNKVPDAQKELETAVNLHPKYAEAWYELGRTQQAQNQAEAAKSSYEKAIEADERYVRPYLALALLEAQGQKWDKVREYTDKVIKLNRYDFPAAFFYGAVASYNMKDYDAAEKLCRAGLEVDPYHSIPKMSHLLGSLLAAKQDYTGASEHLKAYIQFAPKAPDVEMVKKQLAEVDGQLAKTAKP
jgi:tetratricopeptide (TPR) repeat protein